MYAAADQQTSGKAIASLVCGIFLMFFPAALAAVILGHLSLGDIRRGMGRLRGRGMATTGLVLGYMGLAVVPLLIIAAIAIPNLLRARMAANESSAVASVRTLYDAEVSYQADHPTTGYTCNLSDLASAGLIDAYLAGGQRSGYVFSLGGCQADPQGGPVSRFQIAAEPVKFSNTGVNAYCADQSGTIALDRRGSAQNCVANGTPIQ